jgi:hypothetical protein
MQKGQREDPLRTGRRGWISRGEKNKNLQDL